MRTIFTLLLTLISISLFAQDSLQGPQLVFQKGDIISAGRIKPGESRRIRVIITNPGNKTLQLDSVSSYEATVTPKKLRIRAKSSDSIIIMWEPAATDPGNIETGLYFISNAVNSNVSYYDPRKKNMLKITGYIYPDTTHGPAMYFPKGTTHDFGSAPEGPCVSEVYDYINIGKEPLIIQSANSSCGCLTPDWSRDPVLPGKKGMVRLTYCTQGRIGPCTKTVYVNSNDITRRTYSNRIELTIRGIVVKSNDDREPGITR